MYFDDDIHHRYLCCLITGHRISEQIQTSEFKVRTAHHMCMYVCVYIALLYYNILLWPVKCNRELLTCLSVIT